MIPALDTAITALDSLDQQDISVIKCYSRPPFLVTKLVSAVQLLLGYKDPDWASAKKMLGETQFLHKLINIDKDNLPERVRLRRKQK